MHYQLAMSCDDNITSPAQCAYVLYSPNIGCIKTNVLSITFHQVAMCIRPAQKDYSSYVCAWNAVVYSYIERHKQIQRQCHLWQKH